MSDEVFLMPWEELAVGAVGSLLESMSYDEVFGAAVFPSRDDYKHNRDIRLSSMDEVRDYLIEIYNEQWYGHVPVEGGEAVFRDDSWDYVSELVEAHPDLAYFFHNYSAPDDSEELVVAHELLLDANASKVVRVSFEEINDELILYLAKHPEKMREMSPRKFEELVADMFRNQGYEVTLTPQSNDGGMDVIAVQRDNVGTVMVIVECKRYSETNKVGVEVARGLYGVVGQKGATRGVIATTSFFTKGVMEFRETVPHRLGLADFEVLTQNIQDWKNAVNSND